MMRKVMFVAVSQIVFFYYFMFMRPPEHLTHLIFDVIFDWMVLVTMGIGIVLNVGSPKGAFISVVSLPLSLSLMSVMLVLIRPLLFGKTLLTEVQVMVFYVTLAVIWFGVVWILKYLADRYFPE